MMEEITAASMVFEWAQGEHFKAIEDEIRRRPELFQAVEIREWNRQDGWLDIERRRVEMFNNRDPESIFRLFDHVAKNRGDSGVFSSLVRLEGDTIYYSSKTYQWAVRYAKRD